MAEIYFPREILGKLMKYLPDREALIILGSRQVGKSTLLKLIMNEIRGKEQVFYMDLEDTRLLSIVDEGVEAIISYLKYSGASLDRKIYLFIDEIHYMKSPSNFIKLAVDHYSDRLKLICTGSSASGIKIKFKDTMVGRKLIFYLYPLSFREFLIFKRRDELAKLLPAEPFKEEEDVTKYFKEEYLRYFNEFLIFGGYPRVVLEDDIEKKEKILSEIVNSYIYKDIKSIFSIGDIRKFNNFIKLLASQCGSLLNVSQIANDVGISRETVTKYLSILENSFLITMLSPFSKSIKVELKKTNKIYWHDNGIRNYIIGDLSFTSERVDMGVLLENAIFNGIWKKKGETEGLYYWRTKDGAEVDFIYQTQGKLIPIEVKSFSRPHRGIVNFMKKYKLQEAYIAHRGFFEKNEITKIPAYWLT